MDPQRHHDAWETAVRLYLELFSDGYECYNNDVQFHHAVYLGGEVVTRLLYLHPEGPPCSILEHTVRRIQMTSHAALVEHRGQMEVDALLEAGWKWVEREEEHIGGKRLRWLQAPEGLWE